MWNPGWFKQVLQSAVLWLSVGSGEVRHEKPILDILLVLISAYQKGFCCASSLLCLGKVFYRFTTTTYSIYYKVASACRVFFPFLWPSFKNIRLKMLHYVYMEVARQSGFLLQLWLEEFLQVLYTFRSKSCCLWGYRTSAMCRKYFTKIQLNCQTFFSHPLFLFHYHWLPSLWIPSSHFLFDLTSPCRAIPETRTVALMHTLLNIGTQSHKSVFQLSCWRQLVQGSLLREKCGQSKWML